MSKDRKIAQGEGGIQFTVDETSWFASVLAIGSITGSLWGGYVSDKIGRKKSIIIDCIGTVIGFLMIGYFNSFPVIIIGRLLTGHFVGSNMVATPIFVGETSHPDIRDFTGSFLMIMYCSGFTLSMFLGAILHLKIVCYIACLFPIIGIVIMFLMRESPSWLLRQKTEIEAFDCLNFYRGNEEIVRLELDRMRDNMLRIDKQRLSFGDTTSQRLKAKMRRITESSFLKPFLLLNFMLGIGLEWGGFPAIAYYTHTLLEKLQAPVNPYWMAVMLAGFRSVICISLSFILIKMPRRPMFLMSGSLVALSLFAQAAFAWLFPYITPEIMVYAKWIPIVAFFLQYLGFGLGFGVINYLYQGEILPSDMRSIGNGLIGIFDNLFVFLSVKSIPFLIASIGVGGMYCLYTILVLITLVVSFFTMPETKGMSLEDIEDFYTAMKKTERIEKKSHMQS